MKEDADKTGNNLDAARDFVSSLEFKADSFDIDLENDEIVKIPFDTLSTLDSGFSLLNDYFAKPDLLEERVVIRDKSGNILPLSVLNKFKDGSGMLGSYRDASGVLQQARVCSETGKVVSTTAGGPALLLVAAAIAVIKNRLDSIQASVDDVLTYLEEKDKAELRANIRDLERLLNQYRNNWGNETWMMSAHNEVGSILRSTDAATIHLGVRLKNDIAKKEMFSRRGNTAKRLKNVIELLKEYKIACGAFAFASFLEPILSENLSEENLESVAKSIEAKSDEYRAIFKTCRDKFEELANRDLQMLLPEFADNVFSAFSDLAKGLFSTKDSGKELEDSEKPKKRQLKVENLLELMAPVQPEEENPFHETVVALNNLYNQPHMVAVDAENVYVLPSPKEEKPTGASD